MPHCRSVPVPNFVACMASATWKYTSNEAMFSAPTLDKAHNQTPARPPAQAIPSSDSVLTAHPLFPGGEIEEGLFMALKNYSEFGMALDPSSTWLLLSKKDQVRQWCRSMKPLRSLNLPEVISHLSASPLLPSSAACNGRWQLSQGRAMALGSWKPCRVASGSSAERWHSSPPPLASFHLTAHLLTKTLQNKGQNQQINSFVWLSSVTNFYLQLSLV